MAEAPFCCNDTSENMGCTKLIAGSCPLSSIPAPAAVQAGAKYTRGRFLLGFGASANLTIKGSPPWVTGLPFRAFMAFSHNSLLSSLKVHLLLADTDTVPASVLCANFRNSGPAVESVYRF